MPLGTEKTALLGAAAGAFEWDLLDSGCSSSSDGGTWTFTTGSAGGSVTAVTYDGESAFLMDSGGTAADGAYGQAKMILANSDLSSATEWPDPFTMQCRTYLHTIGTFGTGAATDEANIYFWTQETAMNIRFTSPWTSGPSPEAYGTRWMPGSGSPPLIGSIGDNYVGAWHTWGMYVHSFSGSSPLVTADIYVDGSVIASAVTRIAGESADAAFAVNQKGYKTTSRLSYIDYVRIGTGDGRSILTA